MSRDEVTEKYAFDIRQTNYYTDAGRYLNLIDKKYDIRKPLYGLTDIGRKIMSLPYKQRQLELCKCILQHRAFYKTLKCCLDKGEIPIRDEIINIMKSSHLFKVDGESTYYRRASTVNSWIS